MKVLSEQIVELPIAGRWKNRKLFRLGKDGTARWHGDESGVQDSVGAFWPSAWNRQRRQLRLHNAGKLSILETRAPRTKISIRRKRWRLMIQLRKRIPRRPLLCFLLVTPPSRLITKLPNLSRARRDFPISAATSAKVRDGLSCRLPGFSQAFLPAFLPQFTP